MRKIHLLAVLLLLSVLPAYARQRIFGYCEQGGNQVLTGGAQSSTYVQQSFPSCQVSVFLAGTITPAVIYGDNNGQPKGSTFTAASDGYWFFYVDNGRYDVQIDPGVVGLSPFTRGDILAQDGSQATVATYRFTGLSFNSTLLFDGSIPTVYSVTLSGAVTSSSTVNNVQGGFLQFIVCQDSTGGWGFSWPSNFIRPPPVASTPSSCTNAQFVFDGANYRPAAASGDQLSIAVNSLNTPVGVFNFPAVPDLLAGTTAAQTLTNKILGASTTISQQVTWTEIATPAGNPASGALFVYAKTGDGFCVKTNAGLETCFGTGSSSGGVGSGATGQISIYNGTTTVIGDTRLTDTSNTLGYSGTGGIALSGAGTIPIATTAASANLALRAGAGGVVQIGQVGGNTADLQFLGTTSGAVDVKVAAIAGTWTLTLPTTAGTNLQVLQTNGSGVTTWANALGSAGTLNTYVKYTGTGTTVGNGGMTDDGTTVATTEAVDWSGATSVKVKSTAGYAPTTAAFFGYNSTGNVLVFGNGSVTKTVASTDIAGGGTNASSFTANATVYFDGTRLNSAVNAGASTLCWQQTLSGTPVWGSCAGGTSAATDLSNLANPTAISQSLTPGAAGAINVGSTAKPYLNVFIGASANSIALTGTATSARTVTFQNATGTVALLEVAQTFTQAQTMPAVISSTASPSTTGFVRFARADAAKFRNAANSGDLNALSFDASNITQVGDVAGIKVAGSITTVSGDLNLTSASGFISISQSFNSQNNDYLITPANDSTTPTVVNAPACWTVNGTVAACATGQNAQLAGLCVGQCGASGSALIATAGLAPCTFDGNPVTIGDYAIVSRSSGSQCGDGGSTATGAESVGTIYSFVSGTTYQIFVSLGSAPGATTNLVVTNPSSSLGGAQTITSISNSTIPLVVQCASGSTVDCFEVKGPTGTIALKIDKNGLMTVSNGLGTVTATHFVSTSSNPASSAASNVVQLATSDLVAWRNNANSGDITLGKNTSDAFVFTNNTAASTVPPAQVFASATGRSTTFTFVNPGVNQNITVPDSGGASDALVFASAAQSLAGKTINPNLLFATVTAPSNPAGGNVLLYADSVSGNLTCLTSAGANCLPGGSASNGFGATSSVGNTQTVVTMGTAIPNPGILLQDTTAEANANPLFMVKTVGTSVAIPVQFCAKGTTNCVQFGSDAYLKVLGTGAIDLNTAGNIVIEIPNEGTTGTTINLLAKLNTSGQAIVSTTSDLGNLEGVVVSASATTGNAKIVTQGFVSALFDGATTVNDCAVPSITSGGQLHDISCSGVLDGLQLLGKVMTVNGGAGTAATVDLYGRGALAIKGTTNQVNLAFASGALTLSLPQNIHTSASVSFANVSLSGGGTYGGSAVSSAINVIGGKDSSSVDVTGLLTLRGGDFTAVSGHNASSVLLRGGNTATTGTGFAGNVDLEGGQATANTGTGQQNGRLNFDPIYHKGATNTVGNLQCFSADNTVADCGTSIVNFVGVLAVLNGNAAIVIHDGNQVAVNYDATVSPSAGWFACSSATVGGKVTAQSGVCAAGRTVGIIEAAGTSVTTGFVTLEHF